MNDITARVLFNDEQIARMISRMAHEIIEKIAHIPHIAVMLLGIPTRGVTLANRLAKEIERFSEIPVIVGTLDITLYRDDLHKIPHRPLHATQLPFDGIDNKHIIIVDDVLYTGRSVLSALDALRDIGRPQCVQCAVLIDRGHRELPIRADYVGKNIPTSHNEEIKLSLKEIDNNDAITIRTRIDSKVSDG